MSRPVPLMFVSGPPVYTRVPVDGEESTSIFVAKDESSEIAKLPIEIKKVEPLILAQVERLQSSIGQRVYQGLTFVLDDEEIRGNVAKLEGNTLMVEMDGDEDQMIAIELNELQNIIWRGKPLPGD